MLADRNEAVHQRAEELRAAGAKVTALTFDITDPEGVAAAFADILQRHKRLDIVVNNAAIIVRKPFLELPGARSICRGMRLWRMSPADTAATASAPTCSASRAQH